MPTQTNQIVINAVGTYGPPCMMKIISAWWQDATSAGTLVFTDAVGNTYNYTATATGFPTDLGKLDWIHGPIVVTTITSGQVVLVLGNK